MVNTELKKFFERRQQKKILELEGTISFRKDWDYKKDRRDREFSVCQQEISPSHLRQ
jgi:hypothetical protein